MGKENMKSYIGTKLVQAEPFVKAENKKEGYRVVYPNGYESWSPKDVFEKAYLELITNPELKTDKPSISQEMVEDFIVNYDISTKQDKITVVVATLANGFTIVESSSCVSPENYSEEVGALICKENIEKKVWSYLGFLLQTAVKDLDNTFLENKKENKYLSFGQAIEKMKEGKKIARVGWNGKGMYLFIAENLDFYPIGNIDFKEDIKSLNSICMKTAQNNIVIGWLASQTDMLSDDWEVV